MPTLVRTTMLAADPDQIWSLVRQFDELASWHPQVPPSEMEGNANPTTPGATRRFTIDGRVVAREELIDHDDHRRTYSYKVLDQPLPISDFIARIEVLRAPDGAEVRWHATYTGADDIVPVVEKAFGDEVYATGLEALRQRFDRQ